MPLATTRLIWLFFLIAKPHNPSEPPVRRSKNATLRARTGGLVHGTGRVKPNGALKRTDSTKSQHVPPSPLAPKPVSPVKHRTVIDQGPIPLYCSDECQMKDISNSYNGLAFDYDPHRSSPPVPPVPHNSFSDRTAVSESESDSSAGSSVESSSGSSNSSHKQPHVSSSIAVLAAMYNFPPLPPPAPVFPEDDIPARPYNNYQSGIMMAGRRLQEALCPEPPKRTAYGQNYPPEPRKPIPGWTDGSTAWRASLYSFSAPTDLSTSSSQDDITKAYQSFAASPHRSHGVYSTLSDSARAMAAGPFPSRRTEETEELYVKYSESLSRRSESRASLFPVSSPTSISPPNSIQRRERPLVKPGAEGKLLVPNVKMRVHGGSSSSLSSAWCGSSYPATSRRIAKNASHLSDDDAQTDPLSFQRPKTTESTCSTLAKCDVAY